jgi:hypothetical protein
MLGAAVDTVLALASEPGPAAMALKRFGSEVSALSSIVDDTRGRGTGRPERTPQALARAHCALSQVPGGAPVTLACIADHILTC